MNTYSIHLADEIRTIYLHECINSMLSFKMKQFINTIFIAQFLKLS